MGVVLVAASSVLLVVAGIGAEGLEWHAPAECPQESEVAERIEEAGGLGELSVVGVVSTKAPDDWRLDLALDLDGAYDNRVLNAASCDELTEAAVLLIGIRLDAGTAIPEPDPPPPSDPPPESANVETPRASPRIDEGARAEEGGAPAREPMPQPLPALPTAFRPTGLAFGIGAGISLGATPPPGFPVELAVGWSFPRLRVGLRGRYHPSIPIDLEQGRTARVHLGTAGPELCARVGIRRIEFPLCGQVSVGGSRSSGGGPQTQTRAGVWVEAGADAGLSWHLRPRVALTARLGAAAVIRGTRYIFSETEVFDPAPVHGRLLFGAEFHFPIQIGREPENR